jgi:MOSC domain-containing protein YiiM
MSGRVEAVWTTAAEGEPMTAVESASAVSGGLDGDRYQRGTGYYSPFDVCEVTFVAGAALDAIHEEAGLDLSGGEHRRNVVTRGVDLAELLASRFRIGGAVFEGTRPRPPCRHVEEVAGMEGLMDALRDRGGICADVVEAGEFAVGDDVEVLESTAFDGKGLAAAIAERTGRSQDL